MPQIQAHEMTVSVHLTLHFSLSPPLLVMPLASPSLSTRPPVQDNCALLPALTVSCPPFSLYVFLPPCTLGNDDRLLTVAAQCQYAPRTFLNTVPLFC